MKHIASVSFGKDSLAMLLRLLEEGRELDEVVFYNTGMEFQAIYDTRDKVLPLLAERGIPYIELRPQSHFEWKMFEKPVDGPNGPHLGYSWCGGRCRWGTTDKLAALDGYAEEQGAQVYVGIAADEKTRIRSPKRYKQFPLINWGMEESECLTYCYGFGFDWAEIGGAGSVGLYHVLDRVSCWCCANKNLKELRNIYHRLPEYWERLKDLQRRTCRPMKGQWKSVFDLESRFALEDQYVAEGRSITDRTFYSQLRDRLGALAEEAGGTE